MTYLIKKPITTAVIIATIGISCALLFGYSLYNENPDGLLLYTPGQNDPGQKTSSFQFGMSIGAGAVASINYLLSLCSFLFGKFRTNKTAIYVAKSTGLAGLFLTIFVISITKI